MPNQLNLSVKSALLLIEFVSKTNYEISTSEGGILSTKEAVDHVNSEDYSPEIPLNVAFDTNQGNYWDTVEVGHEDGVWRGIDYSMGGVSVSGGSIEGMLVAIRNGQDKTCQFSAVKLIVCS